MSIIQLVALLIQACNTPERLESVLELLDTQIDSLYEALAVEYLGLYPDRAERFFVDLTEEK